MRIVIGIVIGLALGAFARSDRGRDLIRTARGKAREAADDPRVRERIQQVRDGVEKASDTVADLADRAIDAVDELKSQADSAVDQAADLARSGERRVDQVGEQITDEIDRTGGDPDRD